MTPKFYIPNHFSQVRGKCHISFKLQENAQKIKLIFSAQTIHDKIELISSAHTMHNEFRQMHEQILAQEL